MGRRIILVIISGIFLTILFFLPGFFINYHFFRDFWYKNCPFYVDKNNNGICDIVEKLTEFSNENIYNLNEIFSAEVLIFFILLTLSVVFVRLKKFLFLRYAFLLISLIYFGFILRNSICPLLTFQSIFIYKSKVVLGLDYFIIFLLPIIFTLLFGRIFCFWVCPLGAFQEFVYKLGNVLGIKSKPFIISKIIRNRKLDYFKYIFLIIIILGVIIFKKPILCGLDPFGALFFKFITLTSIISLILLVIFDIFIPRVFCRYFCPYGAILSLLHKLRLFK